MAMDILGHVAVESTFAVGMAAGPFFSVGADYSSDAVPNTSVGPNDAGGLDITIATAGGGLGGMDVDLIVETAVENAGTGDEEWVETDSRLNNVIAFGTYRLHITDAICDKVRLKIVKNAGAVNWNFIVRWLSDRAIDLVV